MWKKGIGFAASLAVLFLFGLDKTSAAATFTVTTEADSGIGSLRQAVLDANATPEPDEINIGSGVKVITLASEVNISAPIAVNGGGATLKGSTTRLFSVTRGTAKFDRLTFTKGKAFSGNGGAVNIEGAAKADFVNCTFFDNDAGASGGAVCVTSSSLDATTFLNCTIAGNSAANGGGVATVQGAISFAGTVVVGNTERGGLPQGADVHAASGGTVFNNGRYNVIGHTNAPGSFSSVWGNFTSVRSGDVFLERPLTLTSVDGVHVLKLSSLSGNPARDLIPKGSVGFPEWDARGARRPQLVGLDAGAFELSPTPTVSIDLKGSPYLQLETKAPYTVVVHPSDATRDTRTFKDGIEWWVSDVGVISVDAFGVVSALKTGEATLQAKVHGWDAAGNAVSTSTVSLKIRVGTTPLPAPEVTLKPLSDITVNLGVTRTIKPEVAVSLAGFPADLNYSLAVASSNTAVASADVSSDGKSILIAGKGSGTSQITVTAIASNGAGTGRDMKTFNLNVSNKKSGGGGGCDTGFSVLALALAAIGYRGLRRKGQAG